MNDPTAMASSSATAEDVVVYAHLDSQRSRAAVNGAFWSALNSLIPTLFNSGVFVVTSRFLLPHDFGIVAIALSIVSFVTGIGPAAFGEALIQQQTVRRSHLDTIFWLCFSTSAVLYLALILCIPLLARVVGQDAIAPLLPVLGLKIFFDIMATVPNALIGRSMSYHLFALRTAISTILSSSACLALILAGFGLWALVIAQVASSFASCVASFWGAGWRPGFRIHYAALRELAHYGIFASANRFLQLMSLDQLILGSLAGPTALGVYNFSRRLYQMIQDVIAGGLTSVSHTLLSSLQSDPAKVREAFLITTFGCALVAFPSFMGLAAVAGDAIPVIFGDHWMSAIWPVRGFCVIGLMGGIGVIQASLITSQGKSNWWFYYQLGRSVLTLITVFFLWSYGITVIVAAMALQIILLWPITLWMVSRIIDLRISAYLLQFLGPTIAYLGLLSGTIGIGAVLPHASPTLRLIAEIATGGLFYIALIYLCCRDRVMTIARVVIGHRKSGKKEAAS